MEKENTEVTHLNCNKTNQAVNICSFSKKMPRASITFNYLDQFDMLMRDYPCIYCSFSL